MNTLTTPTRTATADVTTAAQRSALTVTWDAGSNGGTINGKASFSETVKPNSKPTAPSAPPVKTGHTFKNWYTEKTGGKLYNTVTSITASTTFYAQFEANKYTVVWDLGTGQSETTEQAYGEKLVLPADPERKNAEFLGWFTEASGGTQVDSNTTVFNGWWDDVLCTLGNHGAVFGDSSGHPAARCRRNR